MHNAYQRWEDRVARKRLPVALSEEEQAALIGAINTRTTSGLRTRAMVAAMLGAGLRVSEVVNLMPSDIDFKRGEVRVNNGKGGRDRVIPVDGETLGWLRSWAERRSALGLKGRQPFFPRLRSKAIGSEQIEPGERMGTRNVQAIVGRLAARAGIEKDLSCHTCRHTYACNQLDRGLTVREVQELLGHSALSTTAVYLHVNPEALREKIQRGDDSAQDDKQAALLGEIAVLQEKLATLARQVEELETVT
jgi:integrase/recombinase XerD